MDSTNCIEQKGIIEDINKGVAKVNIIKSAACASCQSKAACFITEPKEETLVIDTLGNEFHKGETVSVMMKKSLGLRATLLAYVLPFIVVLLALIVLTSLGVKENLAGLISILILVAYYAILYFFRNSLQKTFQFTLNKLN